MASCLYECLCEAELDKYYPNFTALGFQKIDELAKVSMKDYAKLGVHNMKDRKHLFQLIKIIKILQAEEEEAEKTKPHFRMGAVYLQPQVARPGPRRQLQFDSISDKKHEGKDAETGLCRLSNCFVKKDKDDLATVLGHDSEYKRPPKDIMNTPTAWTEYKLDLPTMTVSNEIAPLLGDTKAPIVQRVAHISGYNYGVPHSCVRPSTSEKETPWTETDKIRVCVRKRPLGLREERRGEVNIITVEDKETLLLHEKKEAVDLTQYILQHVFHFDEVFGEACSNQDVYMKTAHPLIQHIFNGGNATCFAYGQTGAGKTYTMIGTHQNPGLYALAAKDIFRQLETSQARKDLHVWISFYEIYCGQLYDLLNGRKRLFAREDSKHIVQIVGLREVQVDAVNLLLEVILKGGKERSTGATGVNSDSSRSHAIIQIQIKDTANRVFGRISFIDLAGSERAADARDSDRQTKMEGAEINQSLLALKECIRALDQEHAHTPFRQSKLTQVLKDSFIGNSKTCMIANVSPSHIATEHTLNTLRYADRVKELKKGMRSCVPGMNRRRTTGSMSPKRIQSSPCVQSGEKSSPKKVKLTLHSSAVAAPSTRMKMSPVLFHPMNPHFSSTPKGTARKGNPVTAWLGHTSPLKGAQGAGLPAKKVTEDLVQLSEDRVGQAASSAKIMREGGQGDRQRARSRKVQPVRKQLISRTDFSLGDARCPLACVPNSGRVFAEQCAAAWTSLPPQQKDREQHLRLYHQQFQQPPILQQKLNYQPLERFLGQYKPQGVRVQPESPGQPPPSPQCRDETMQLEDLEDSDFSEDSFSPGPSRRKPEADTSRERSQGSFFLHRRDFETDEREVQIGQELFFELPELESKSRALPRSEEFVSYEESTRSQSDWSTEESSTLDSPPQNDTPEKPYCSQGDKLVCKRSCTKETHAGLKPHHSIDLDLGCPEESFSFSGKATQILPFAHALGSSRCVARGQGEDSLKGQHTPCSGNSEKGLRKRTDLCGTLAFSLDFVARTRTPLTVSVLDTETADAAEDDAPDEWQRKALREGETVGKDPFSSKTQVEEEPVQFLGNKASPTAPVYELDPCRSRAAQLLSPQARPKGLSQPCHSPKVPSSLGDTSPSAELHGCVCGFSAGDAGLAEVLPPCKEEGTLLRGDVQVGANATGTEATRIASISSPAQFRLGGKDASEPVMQLQHAATPEKVFVSRVSENKEPSGESIPMQPVVEVEELELGHPEEQFELTFNPEEAGLSQDRSVPEVFVQKSPDAAEQDAGMDTRSPQSSPNGTSESSLRYKEALGRQFVIQIRQEQTDEMAALSLREEALISQMSELDLADFVMKLEGILQLQSKCIQRTRTRLQPLLATLRGVSPT
ncbi:kinesin-like protein KIF24 [Eublepharis macularius]|uniref:Kinesin-like protein KIF24 n=1 Tax=Eublepharis macularius TaxID=481883 RepID=A0AA97L567_EUBMA|nr:kinesin-like protein KIF24 [Eublepharis macularius]